MTDEVLKKGSLDPVADVLAAAPGSLKIIRKDGVSSPRCGVVQLVASEEMNLAATIMEWSDHHRGALTFEFVIASDLKQCLIVYTTEMSKDAIEVMQIYGQEIQAKVAEITRKREIQREAELDADKAFAKETTRKVYVADMYEKRLGTAKKMKKGKEQDKVFREIEQGGAHYEVFFESLKGIMQSTDKSAEPLKPLVEMLAKKTGIAGMLNLAVTTESEPEKTP